MISAETTSIYQIAASENFFPYISPAKFFGNLGLKKFQKWMNHFDRQVSLLRREPHPKPAKLTQIQVAWKDSTSSAIISNSTTKSMLPPRTPFRVPYSPHPISLDSILSSTLLSQKTSNTILSWASLSLMPKLWNLDGKGWRVSI